jgi:hypothetical protein
MRLAGCPAIAGMRIALQGLLDAQGQRVHTATHSVACPLGGGPNCFACKSESTDAIGTLVQAPSTSRTPRLIAHFICLPPMVKRPQVARRIFTSL